MAADTTMSNHSRHSSEASTQPDTSEPPAPVIDEDPAATLRAAALLTLKAKRKKVGPSSAPVVAPPQRRPVHDNGVQLDYGAQDDQQTAPAPSTPKEDGEIEEGEISDSDMKSPEPPKVSLQKRIRSPSPERPRKRSNADSIPAPIHTLPPIYLFPTSSSFPSASSSETASVPSPLVDRISGPHRRQSDASPTSPLPSVPEIRRARPGLDLTPEQYEIAKDIVLDLLGWGVSPEYLVDCGLSREVVYYVFTELNLRLPHNLDVAGIVPQSPTKESSRARAPSQSQPGNAPTSVAPVPPMIKSKTFQPHHHAADLNDMERQRRNVLLARKAAQLSRKAKAPPPAPEPEPEPFVRPPSIMPTEDVEMLAPIEDVDDFLRTIAANDSRKTETTSDPSPSAQPSRSPSIAASDLDVSRIEKDLLSPSEPSPPLKAAPLSINTAISTSSNATTQPPTSIPSTPKGAGIGSSRRRARPVAADFVDSGRQDQSTMSSMSSTERTGRSRNGSGNTFASVSALRRCVIELSDSEDEDDAVITETSSVHNSNVAPTPVALTPVLTPAEVLENKIATYHKMIAEKELANRSKKLARSNTVTASIPPTPSSPTPQTPLLDAGLKTVLESALQTPDPQPTTLSVLQSYSADVRASSLTPGKMDLDSVNGVNSETVTLERVSESTIVPSSSSPVDVNMEPLTSQRDHVSEPEQDTLNPPLPENASATHYRSLFRSYPLMLSQPISPSFPLISASPGQPPIPSDVNSVISTVDLSKRASMALPDLGPLKLATISKTLDPSKRVCQYEVPGGGICRDPSCDDLHLSRLSISPNQTNVEPSDAEIASFVLNGLSKSMPTSSLTFERQVNDFKVALHDVRQREPTWTIEERVRQAFQSINAGINGVLQQSAT